MSDHPASNQKDIAAQSDKSKLAETKPKPQPPLAETPKRQAVGRSGRLQSFARKVGTLNYLLLGLVISVVGALYLSCQELVPNNSNPPARVIIVQLNDIYRLDAVRSGKRGGLARVVTLLRQLKTQNPQVPVIVLHAGDFLSPSLESQEFHGAQMIDALNFINEVAPLYVVPGNHEFDYKVDEKRDETEYLTNAINNSNFLWVASNIERNNPTSLQALLDHTIPHKVVPFAHVKLGIFGLTLQGSYGKKDKPYAVISGDYANIARAEIEHLEREGADLIVGLTHLNLEDDHELAKLKQGHPRFLWLAGGHEHSLIREPASTDTALITKGDSNARTVWKISVVKNGRNVEIREESIVIDDTIQPDPAFTQNIENFYRMKLRNLRPYLDTSISSIVPINPDANPDSAQPNPCYDGTEEAVRNRESNWGDFLTDTMRNAYKPRADIAVLSSGSIRIDDIVCGQITFESLERTFAYPTPVVFVEIQGKDLRKYILENSVKSKRDDGRFLQVSGVSFRRVLSADTKEMVIKDLQIQTAKGAIAFDDNKLYVVAVNKWIFDCEDRYDFRPLVTRYFPPDLDKALDLRALTYAALSAQPKKSKQVVGRIKDLPDYVKMPSMPALDLKELTKKKCP